MNPTQNSDSEALRSNIDVTRRRMDETIEALGDRMQPQHLLDEVLGYFRRTDDNGSNRLSHMRDSITHGTSTAVNAVVDTVKNNPIPTLLIGAGVGWMIYNSRRSRTESWEPSPGPGYEASYDPDTTSSHEPDPAAPGPGGMPATPWNHSGDSKLGAIKDGIGDAAQSAKEKLGALRATAGEKMAAARQRAGEFGSRVRERSGEMYQSTRERVATTADNHPLETGLVCLAAGIIAGLALPTPAPVNRQLGPAADRLRERARESGQEALAKGRRIASAAVGAAKDEAQAQGLTPAGLRDKAGAIADRARDSGREAARAEGVTGTAPASDASGIRTDDPTFARPAV